MLFLREIQKAQTRIGKWNVITTQKADTKVEGKFKKKNKAQRLKLTSNISVMKECSKFHHLIILL